MSVDRLWLQQRCSVLTANIRLKRIKRSAKMSVQEYIEKHELPKRVEEVINATVKAKPDEPLSYMVRCRIISLRSFKIVFAAHQESTIPQIEFRSDACRARYTNRMHDMNMDMDSDL